MRIVPFISLPRKLGYILLGIVLGVLLQGLRNVFNLQLNFGRVSSQLIYVDLYLGWSEWYSYFMFTLASMSIIRLRWRSLIRQKQLEQLAILPEGSRYIRRALFLPASLVLVPALLVFICLRFIGATLYSGADRALLMSFGWLPEASGIIYTFALSIFHAAAIVCLTILAAIPFARDLTSPSALRTGYILLSAFTAPMIFLFLERRFAHLQPALMQVPFVLLLALIIKFDLSGKRATGK